MLVEVWSQYHNQKIFKLLNCCHTSSFAGNEVIVLFNYLMV